MTVDELVTQLLEGGWHFEGGGSLVPWKSGEYVVRITPQDVFSQLPDLTGRGKTLLAALEDVVRKVDSCAFVEDGEK